MFKTIKWSTPNNTNIGVGGDPRPISSLGALDGGSDRDKLLSVCLSVVCRLSSVCLSVCRLWKEAETRVTLGNYEFSQGILSIFEL